MQLCRNSFSFLSVSGCFWLLFFLFAMQIFVASKHQPFVAGVEKIKSIKLQMLLDAELSDFYVSVYKIIKETSIAIGWMWLAVISALLLRGRWRRLSLRPILELLPACPSPHRSPDWSNRPWTPRPSGPRCGPEIGQTPNDRAPHREDEPIVTRGWWRWRTVTMRSTACRETMKTWRTKGHTFMDV